MRKGVVRYLFCPGGMSVEEECWVMLSPKSMNWSIVEVVGVFELMVKCLL